MISFFFLLLFSASRRERYVARTRRFVVVVVRVRNTNCSHFRVCKISCLKKKESNYICSRWAKRFDDIEAPLQGGGLVMRVALSVDLRFVNISCFCFFRRFVGKIFFSMVWIPQSSSRSFFPVRSSSSYGKESLVDGQVE